MKVKKRTSKPAVQYGGWDLFKHGVSSSFVNKFLQCRMQCQLLYKDGWVETKQADYLDWGSMFHAIKEEAYAKKKPPTVAQITKWADAFTKKEREKRGGRLPEYWEGLTEQVIIVAEKYFEKFPEDFTSRTWIGAEEHVTIDYELSVPYPSGWRKVTIPLHGTLDGVFTQKGKKVSKETWIFDTKTKSRIDGEEALDLMQWVFQFNLYMYLYWKAKGVLPTGFVLNMVKRPSISRRRKRQPETVAEFYDRLRKSINEDPDDYFMRVEERYSQASLEAWRHRQLEPILLDIYLWATGVTPTYVNPMGFYVRNARTGLFQALVNDNFTTLKRKQFTSLQDKN